jgi:hypothetical protein
MDEVVGYGLASQAKQTEDGYEYFVGQILQEGPRVVFMRLTDLTSKWAGERAMEGVSGEFTVIKVPAPVVS